MVIFVFSNRCGPVILGKKIRACGADQGMYYSDAGSFFLLKGAGQYFRNFDTKNFVSAALSFFFVLLKV